MLLDSSSSLLFSLLLAQLPVLTVASPVHHRRPSDMDKLSNQTKNLMKLTQELLVSRDFIPSEISNRSHWSVVGLGWRCPDGLMLIELWVFGGVSGGGGGGEGGEGWSTTWLICPPFAEKQLLLNYTRFAPDSIWLSCFRWLTDWLGPMCVLTSGQQKPPGEKQNWVSDLTFNPL